MVGAKTRAALAASFWEYARLALPEARLERLEAMCRRVGAGPSPANGAGARGAPQALCVAVRVASKREGKRFVRRAGYYGGSALARRYVQAAAHPARSAERMAHELADAMPGATLHVGAGKGPALRVRIESTRPLDPPVVEYTTGFVRGCAARLNEGEAPAIQSQLAPGGRTWTASVRFAQPRSAPATGERRTRRR